MPSFHLTPFERMEIQTSLGRGHSKAEIARNLGRHPSTVGREIRRNTDRRRYSAVHAQIRYLARRAVGGRTASMQNEGLKNYVEAALREDWSPEEIAGRLFSDFSDDPGMRVSHETIYLYVYADKKRGGDLYMHLRQSRSQRRKRLNSKAKRALIHDRISIEKRPSIVDKQRRIGDWEGDTIFGKGHGTPLATFVDRKSLYTLIASMENKSATSLHAASLQAFKDIPPAFLHTLTVDNGSEFAHFKAIEKDLGLAIFFGRPYTATDRAINENTNGLIRQYLPKKTDFKNLTSQQLQAIVDKLNNRPRKKLGYRTPNEVLHEAFVALRS